MKFKLLERKLKRVLPPARFAHSVSVARLCAQWAGRWGVAPERAFVAGLLHDCARGLSEAQQGALLRGYRGRYWNAALRAFPALWHNPAGVYLAVHRYGIRDGGILRAMALHSTGGPRMQLLDRILFVADYCDPLRKFPGLARLRALAGQDLEAAVKAVARAKFNYLKRAGQAVHPNLSALIKVSGRPASTV